MEKGSLQSEPIPSKRTQLDQYISDPHGCIYFLGELLLVKLRYISSNFAVNPSLVTHNISSSFPKEVAHK